MLSLASLFDIGVLTWACRNLLRYDRQRKEERAENRVHLMREKELQFKLNDMASKHYALGVTVYELLPC